MSSFSLRNHVVIFNYPGTARLVRLLEEFSLDPAFGAKRQIVLVDEDMEELPTELAKWNVHYVRGNPVRNETLFRASMEFADHAVVLCKRGGEAVSDNLNISITLAIEGCNKNIKTVVEIVDSASAELLQKAGCDRIVCTSNLGAHFLSQELLNPGVQEVVEDLLSARKGQNMYLVESGDVRTFGEAAMMCRKKGHMALGIRTKDEVLLNPEDASTLKSGDRVITIGPSRIATL